MKTKTIRQTVNFKAAPMEVYEMIMDSKKHQSLSGEKAKISRKIGGPFTAWGGHLTGINLCLKPGERIVQAWRATGWPPDYYSGRNLRIEQGRNGHKAPLHPDRRAPEPLQRPLSRLDRDLLDSHEGSLRNRQDQRKNHRPSQDRQNPAHRPRPVSAKADKGKLRDCPLLVLRQTHFTRKPSLPSPPNRQAEARPPCRRRAACRRVHDRPWRGL